MIAASTGGPYPIAAYPQASQRFHERQLHGILDCTSLRSHFDATAILSRGVDGSPQVCCFYVRNPVPVRTTGDITSQHSAPELSELIEAANRACAGHSGKTPALTLIRHKAVR